jgi:DNA modification methylase
MSWEIREGSNLDLLREMEEGSVQTTITSPPYWNLRDYGAEDQLGLEETPEQYIENMVDVFREVRRVLRDDGTLWINIGDSFGKKKQLVGIPWRLAFALQEDGWILRSDIIWSKTNPMPESVTDRPTKAHEYIFLLAKSQKYYYDADAIRAEPSGNAGSFRIYNNGADGSRDGNDYEMDGSKGANKKTVWTVPTAPYKDAHFAVYPAKLIEPCVLAGSAAGDVVLDPFSGAATTGLVALRHDRSYIGLELNPEYAAMSRERIRDDAPLLNYGLEVA